VIAVAGLLCLGMGLDGARQGIPAASAHHRNQFQWHYAGYPSTIPVWLCSGNATAVQTAVTNWNAQAGAMGVPVPFTYQGSSCINNGIVVSAVSSLPNNRVGQLRIGVGAPSSQEIVKDWQQNGRVFFDNASGSGYAGQWKVSRWNLDVLTSLSGQTLLTTVAHELGHAVGLHEHYIDTGASANCSAPYGSPTVMDCAGAGSESGPAAHDVQDVQTRWPAAPWGTGAVWLTIPFAGAVQINWADINDNESTHYVYRNGSYIGFATADQRSLIYLGSISPSDYVYVVASNAYGSNSSAVVYGTPPAPPGSSIYGLSVATDGCGGGTPCKTISGSICIPPTCGYYTHSFVMVYKGSTHIGSWYGPWTGGSVFTQRIRLGELDGMPGTYSMEVYRCSANYNPWFNGCVFDGSVSSSMAP
jgi:hypothetical protein